nr:immunoglobulin light chain junction region [Macaca mulatta]MOX78098.1 immunoglobulin light chain junction region [Macaca mulatta]MOX78241.1 immunoglobulin light chain junction region [Macaca mulatta]MOX78309.1 immunoglobulin light chain junction region [Macaca mulatta]MOX78313.1 immunoglobulin light chain junction region [Macaca mulatta]
DYYCSSYAGSKTVWLF